MIGVDDMLPMLVLCNRAGRATDDVPDTVNKRCSGG